jgi:DNA-binding NarL/FixJ family response regulator
VTAVRVLIVDDQEPFRRAAAAVVTVAEGFELAGAVESAQECLAAVPALVPDLVLMDIDLPGIDGIEAARRLSLLPEPPVVVLISTHDPEEFGDRARACGAVAYLSKSAFGPERLADAWALATGIETRRIEPRTVEPAATSARPSSSSS